MIIWYLVTCLILITIPNEAARILAVFPTPSISHQVVFRPLTQELAKRGHEVTVITTDPAFPKGEAPSNLTEIDVHDISYDIWKKIFMTSTQGGTDDVIHVVKAILKSVIAVVEAQYNDKSVQNIIKDKSKKFDLILLEACVRPALAYSHIYKAPVIQVSSFGGILGNYWTMGASEHPILYPVLSRQRIHNLSQWDKIKEVFSNYMVYKLYEQNEESENAMIRKNFGEDVPPVMELSNNVDMMFLNIHPIFEGIRPVPPSIIYMGGMHQKPGKELPADLKNYLDSSKHGVIYISFGTNVDPTTLPADRIEVLVKTVSQLPYDVLWKWNNDHLPGRTENIRISKWLPQSDLLKHPKVKLFVTQAGLQSTDEAITAGVPLIAIPMIADQFFNAEKYEYHNIGIKLLLDTLTIDKFKNAINTIIEDQSYRRNIVKLRNIMQDEPMKPLERAVWWTEHVLRHGGARHLRSPAANMSWAEYLELELVLTVLLALLVALTLFVLILRFIYKYVYSNFVTPLKLKDS